MDEVILLLGWAGGCSVRGLTERQQPQHWTSQLLPRCQPSKWTSVKGAVQACWFYPMYQGSRGACCESSDGSQPTWQARFASMCSVS